jgi:HTH-type transcriptional regulator, competence development regulator
MELFGEYIRNLRESRNLPLRKVAAFLDIDTSILSKIERGKRKIGKDMIIKIADYFSIDGDMLVEDYLSERIAEMLIDVEEYSGTLQKVDAKVVILKSKKTSQSEIVFKNE